VRREPEPAVLETGRVEQVGQHAAHLRGRALHAPEGPADLRIRCAAGELLREHRGAHGDNVQRRPQIVADDCEELLARQDHLACVRVRGGLILQETERLIDRQVRIAALTRQILIRGAPLGLEQPLAGPALLLECVFDVAALGFERLVEPSTLFAERFVGLEPLLGKAFGDFPEAVGDVRQPFGHLRLRLAGRCREGDGRSIAADFAGRFHERRHHVLKRRDRVRVASVLQLLGNPGQHVRRFRQAFGRAHHRPGGRQVPWRTRAAGVAIPVTVAQPRLRFLPSPLQF
jgi:hypothetical protein